MLAAYKDTSGMPPSYWTDQVFHNNDLPVADLNAAKSNRD